MSACLTSLPDEVLKLVMQHVPLRQRLTSCCLVNMRLHAAAVAATEQLVLLKEQSRDSTWRHLASIDTLERVQSALGWLDHYGHHLTYLKMSGFPQPQQQLQCTNLQQLVLERCSVQLGPAADGSPGVVQCCTKLTYLDLWCEILDAPTGAVLHDSLSGLVHLQNLRVLPKDRQDRCYSVKGLSSGTLPRLRHLTHLHVRSLSVANLAQLGALANLQELVLQNDSDIAVSPRSVPGLVFPASLTRFVVWSAIDTGLLSVVPAGLKCLDLSCPVEGPSEGPGCLLSGMARLQHLTSFELFPSRGLDWPPASPAYSALTASSELVRLGLIRTTVPAGVWPYVFPATHKLPHLTYSSVSFESAWQNVPPSAFGAADVVSLVSCCPNLKMIVALSLRHGRHVAELHKLTALTNLHVTYGSRTVAAIEQSLLGLAAVTQLRALDVCVSSVELTVGSLLPLTSLTNLVSFDFCCMTGNDEDIGSDGDSDASGADWDVYLTEDQDSDLPVWLRLLERCAEDPGCHPAALRTTVQQLTEHRALTEQQLSAQQRQIADLQVQLSGQQQLVSDQQQQLFNHEQLLGAQIQHMDAQVQLLKKQHRQLSAQKQVVAEQGVQITGLQGQLQAMQAQLQELLQRQQQ